MKFNHIFMINGSARSGTTWTAEMINYRRDWLYLFEPFHNCVDSKGNGFHWNPPDAVTREVQEFFARQVFSGEVTNWTKKKRRVNKPEIGSGDKLLVKSIRSHYHLQWMKNLLPNITVVQIFRHPCASAHGRQVRNYGTRLGTEKNSKFMMDQWFPWLPMEVFEGDHLTHDKYVLRWCMENYVVLKSFNFGELPIFFYENLCERPHVQFNKMFSLAGQKYTPKAKKGVKKPSRVTSGNSANITGGEDLLAFWTKHVTDDEKKKAQELLELFKLDSLYNAYDLRPNLNALKDIMEIKYV